MGVVLSRIRGRCAAGVQPKGDEPEAPEVFVTSEEIAEILAMNELRPSSSASTDASPYGALRARLAAGRPVSIDTSRAKTNKPVVSLCARKLGLQEFAEGRDDDKSCDIYWHNIVYQDMKAVVRDANARVNKFPGMTELSKKISLTRAITSMRSLFPEEYDFYPRSWFIPAQLDDFYEHCRLQQLMADDSDDGPYYIVKPDDGAQGTGIYLIRGPDELRDVQNKQLIQEYIADPFLMGDGLKFDFRVYVVIKGINPLSIYVAREGMARFCTEKYAQPTSSNFENLFAHLTNYSLNKVNNSYVHSNSLQDQLRGSKRLLSTVFHQMEARGVRTKRLWHNIKLLIVKTVLAMVPEMILNYEHYFCDAPGPQCFQIMGFDVLVRQNLEPILLEVNSAPSLTIDHCIGMVPNGDGDPQAEPPRVRSIVDEVIKIPLVRDTILLVLDLLDDVYTARSFSTGSTNSSNNGNVLNKTVDDLGELKAKRKSHLSEIFPCRYGAHSGHLLFLDRAVYLFMQFINLKLTSTMSLPGARAFLKKCNLLNVISQRDLEAKFAEIYTYFTGDDFVTNTSGLGFHGFLSLLYYIAEVKYPICEDLLSRVQRLLAFCDVSLRHYGVRSARLRRTQIESENNERAVQIFLLPSRLRERRSSRSGARPAKTQRKSRLRNGRSLPRHLEALAGRARSPADDFNERTIKRKNEELVLPKIRPPFLF